MSLKNNPTLQPKYAPYSTNSNTFDPAKGLYNGGPEKFRKFRAALGKAQAGTAYCRIAHVGDSTTEGVGVTTARMAGSWPGQLSQMLVSAGYTLDGSFGLVQAYTNNSGYWPEYTTTGTWTAGLGLNPTLIGTTSATMTFTSTNTGTIIDIRYLNTGASFSYTVDGGASTNVTTNGGQSVGVQSITGLANTTHTVVITSGSNTQIVALHVHSAATSGIQFWNAGIGSSRTDHWYNGGAWYAGSKLVSAWSPNMTTIKLGINDATAQAVPPANYQANMQAMITQALTTGDVLLLTPVPANTVDLSQYLPILYLLADINNVPLLDMTYRWKDYTTMNGLGVYSDGYHPNQAGYNDEARAVYNALMG